MVERVQRNADTLATVSSEIAEGNHNLSARTESQASALEQTSASLHELASTVRHNADAAPEANPLAQAASQVAQRTGVSQVSEAVGQMDQVTQHNAALVEEVAAAAGSLRAQAQDLVQSVAVFRLTA